MENKEVSRNDMLSIYDNINISKFDVKILNKQERKVLKVILEAIKSDKLTVKVNEADFSGLHAKIGGQKSTEKEKNSLLEKAKNIFNRKISSKKLNKEIKEIEKKRTDKQLVEEGFYSEVKDFCAIFNRNSSAKAWKSLIESELVRIEARASFIKQAQGPKVKIKLELLDSVATSLKAILKKLNSSEQTSSPGKENILGEIPFLIQRLGEANERRYNFYLLGKTQKFGEW